MKLTSQMLIEKDPEMSRFNGTYVFVSGLKVPEAGSIMAFRYTKASNQCKVASFNACL